MSNKYFDKSYREILTEACSDAPTPGGGSVAAMVACLGNGMVAMVGSLTKGKEKYADVQDETVALLDRTQDIMVCLEGLVNEDMAVFNQFMDTLRMPKASEDEKKARSEAMQKAYIAATEVPLTIAETCLEIIELAAEICSYGNKTAISDVGVGAYVAEASLHGALLSVDINLGGIKDKEYVDRASARKAIFINKAREAREKAVVIVKERM